MMAGVRQCPAQGPLCCVCLPSFSVPTGCPPSQVVIKAGGRIPVRTPNDAVYLGSIDQIPVA